MSEMRNTKNEEIKRVDSGKREKRNSDTAMLKKEHFLFSRKEGVFAKKCVFSGKCTHENVLVFYFGKIGMARAHF